MQLVSSNTISSTSWINTPERYMADARCAMNLRGTFFVFVYGTKPRRVKLSLAPEPHGTKYFGTDGKVTRFFKFAAWSPREFGPNLHSGGVCWTPEQSLGCRGKGKTLVSMGSQVFTCRSASKDYFSVHVSGESFATRMECAAGSLNWSIFSASMVSISVS